MNSPHKSFPFPTSHAASYSNAIPFELSHFIALGKPPKGKYIFSFPQRYFFGGRRHFCRRLSLRSILWSQRMAVQHSLRLKYSDMRIDLCSSFVAGAVCDGVATRQCSSRFNKFHTLHSTVSQMKHLVSMPTLALNFPLICHYNTQTLWKTFISRNI